MENLDSHGYITVPKCRSASVHFPLKDRQLNTLHLTWMCICLPERWTNDPESVLGAWKFPKSPEWNDPDF